jgi:glutathione S-transferase
MTNVEFYSGTKNASSWAMRAWLALRAADIDFREVIVDIRRPQRFANLAAIGRFAPPATVPVLVVEGRAIFDSLAIMEYANDMAHGTLLPSDPLLRAGARSIMGWQHAGLMKVTPRISFESAFYPDRRQLTDQEIEEVGTLMGHLEQCLGRSGGPFLFGACSLADLALVPGVLKYDRHNLSWTNWPLLKEWVRNLLTLPSVVEWLSEADSLPHIWDDQYLPLPEKAVSAANAWVERPLIHTSTVGLMSA